MIAQRPRRARPSAPGRAAGALLLLAALGGTSCRNGPDSGNSERYNLLIVSVDSLRADHIGAAGYARDTTPVLDAFLAESTWFTDAWSGAPWTTPSMMTMITGLDPEAHQVQAENLTLDPEAETLAERLGAAGYRTLGVVPAVTLGPHFGFAQGFDAYTSFTFGHWKLCSRQLNAEARRLLGAPDDRPWFLWVHYWDPHYNYNPPEPQASRYRTDFRPPPGTVYNVGELKREENPLRDEEVEYLVSQYDAEVRYTDRFLGDMLALLEERGEAERTLVVILADHGESFQEHGWLGHTNRVDETLVHVPLAMRLPGVIEAGRRVDQPVGVVDLLPTVLEVLGVAYDPESLTGRSLAEAATSGAELAEVPVSSETVRRGAWYALRRGDLKYVLDFESCRESLFDLSSDPGERRDLASARGEDLAALRDLARAQLERARSLELQAIRTDADLDTVEQLCAIGYLDPEQCEAIRAGGAIGDPSAESTDLRPGRCLEAGAP